MLHVIAGGEDKWRARPFVSQSNCFVVPPLKFATDACRCLEVAVRGGMPVLLLSAGQAGATAPAALAGAIVQEVAEVLAGLVYVNAIKPGASGDLRHLAASSRTCAPAPCRAAARSRRCSRRPAAQMAHFYDLTGGTASGMTRFQDARRPGRRGEGATTTRWSAMPAPT